METNKLINDTIISTLFVRFSYKYNIFISTYKININNHFTKGSLHYFMVVAICGNETLL